MNAYESRQGVIGKNRICAVWAVIRNQIWVTYEATKSDLGRFACSVNVAIIKNQFNIIYFPNKTQIKLLSSSICCKHEHFVNRLTTLGQLSLPVAFCCFVKWN